MEAVVHIDNGSNLLVDLWKTILEETMNGKIKALYRGKPKKLLDHQGNEYISGINKEEVDYLTVKKHIIAGDDVANKTFHGGEDRVICILLMNDIFF